MSDPERRALALRLFGTGVKGEPHGPLDPQWVVTHLAGSRQTLKRWRASGIPQDRIEDVVEAVQGLVADTTKEAAPPEWAERLEAKVDQLVIGAIADPVQRETVRRLAARLGVLPKPSVEGFDDLPDMGGQGASVPGGQGSS